jgi:putative transposase
MTRASAAVLRVGDRVCYGGADHQVVAMSGTSVRLRSDCGEESVVLLAYLMACPEFAVVGAQPLPQIEPFGLLDAVPEKVLDEARRWQRHLVEVETGLAPDGPPGLSPRPEFDPSTTTMAERDRAKAAELGVSVRTVQTRRARYAQQGLWGLVDQRAVRLCEATGRADARLVTAIRELVEAETDTSTGTRSRLIRRVVKRVEEIHGPGVVPLPGKTTFYKLIDAVATGRHTFGSAVTRRQTANRPQTMFTPSFAARPGEQCRSIRPRWM